MLIENLSFEKRAELLYRNVCDFPEDILSFNFETSDADVIIDGLKAFRQLLLSIYNDTDTYITDDQLEYPV